MIKTPLSPMVIAVVKAKAARTATRTDMKTRAVIDKAIELQGVIGTSVAAGLLRKQHVPFNVAQRVLRHPEQRRKI